MAKGVILIPGLGAFRGAGLRLCLQCKPLESSHDIILLNDRSLEKLAQSSGLTSGCFSARDRGYGFWQWKFLFISHYCNMGYSQVVYLDAGCDANSHYLRKLLCWFVDQRQFDLVLSRTYHSIAQYTKPGVIRYFLKGPVDAKIDCNVIEMLQAGFILLKPDTLAASLFKQAASLVIQGKKYFFDDTREAQEDFSCCYIEHRHDQSVLNLLLLAKADLDRVGVLNSSLTPPGHLKGWGAQPPVIASRNWSCLPMYQIILRFGGYANAPRSIRFIWRLMHIIAKKMRYPWILLAIYARLDQLLVNCVEEEPLSNPLFSEDGLVAPAPVFMTSLES
jgi:hypothetical protein